MYEGTELEIQDILMRLENPGFMGKGQIERLKERLDVLVEQRARLKDKGFKPIQQQPREPVQREVISMTIQGGFDFYWDK